MEEEKGKEEWRKGRQEGGWEREKDRGKKRGEEGNRKDRRQGEPNYRIMSSHSFSREIPVGFSLLLGISSWSVPFPSVC